MADNYKQQLYSKIRQTRSQTSYNYLQQRKHRQFEKNEKMPICSYKHCWNQKILGKGTSCHSPQKCLCFFMYLHLFLCSVHTIDFKKHVSTRVNPAGLNFFNWKISNKTGPKVPCFPIRYLKKKPAFPVPKKVIFHSQDDKANCFQLIKHSQINKQHH